MIILMAVTIRESEVQNSSEDGEEDSDYEHFEGDQGDIFDIISHEMIVEKARPRLIKGTWWM